MFSGQLVQNNRWFLPFATLKSFANGDVELF